MFRICLMLSFAAQILCVDIPTGLVDESLRLRPICKAKTGITDEMIEEGHNGHIVDDMALKCYIGCLLEETDMLTGDGGIDVEKMIAYMPPETLPHYEREIRICANIKGVDKCDTGYKLALCHLKENREGFFLL